MSVYETNSVVNGTVRTDDRIKFVGEIRGYKEIEKEVKEA